MRRFIVSAGMKADGRNDTAGGTGTDRRTPRFTRARERQGVRPALPLSGERRGNRYADGIHRKRKRVVRRAYAAEKLMVIRIARMVSSGAQSCQSGHGSGGHHKIGGLVASELAVKTAPGWPAGREACLRRLSPGEWKSA